MSVLAPAMFQLCLQTGTSYWLYNGFAGLDDQFRQYNLLIGEMKNATTTVNKTIGMFSREARLLKQAWKLKNLRGFRIKISRKGWTTHLPFLLFFGGTLYSSVSLPGQRLDPFRSSTTMALTSGTSLSSSTRLWNLGRSGSRQGSPS